ncbi:hypothetical protein LTR37_003230 [Vermiconidia calcicola]|uniref:Uncharacterized protein n=1 Tax=Vermiconidia calcicola TaxID=1690605 RepID=A0ACC3NR16_9PEZI|nr:hypothetical protein LTR37_003230 [Vermiconidia calcicola]
MAPRRAEDEIALLTRTMNDQTDTTPSMISITCAHMLTPEEYKALGAVIYTTPWVDDTFASPPNRYLVIVVRAGYNPVADGDLARLPNTASGHARWTLKWNLEYSTKHSKLLVKVHPAYYDHIAPVRPKDSPSMYQYPSQMVNRTVPISKIVRNDVRKPVTTDKQGFHVFNTRQLMANETLTDEDWRELINEQGYWAANDGGLYRNLDEEGCSMWSAERPVPEKQAEYMQPLAFSVDGGLPTSQIWTTHPFVEDGSYLTKEHDLVLYKKGFRKATADTIVLLVDDVDGNARWTTGSAFTASVPLPNIHQSTKDMIGKQRIESYQSNASLQHAAGSTQYAAGSTQGVTPMATATNIVFPKAPVGDLVGQTQRTKEPTPSASPSLAGTKRKAGSLREAVLTRNLP